MTDRYADLRAALAGGAEFDDMTIIVVRKGDLRTLLVDYDRMRDALTSVIGEVDDLIGESSGVYGLHLNGYPSPWDEVVSGGRFERLGALEEARAALAQEGS